MSYLPAVETESNTITAGTKTASMSVIWLHGLGASGHDFAGLVPEIVKKLQLDQRNINMRFIFPHAGDLAVTINGGMAMPAWYDILSMGNGENGEREINQQQFQQSVVDVQKLIDREIERGVASDKILMLGFSQGGAVAYHSALTYSKKLAGLAALSTYFLTKPEFNQAPVNQEIDIQIYHGRFDPVVPEAMGLKAQKDLTLLGYNCSYKNYAMEHQLCLEQLEDIVNWMQTKLFAC